MRCCAGGPRRGAGDFTARRNSLPIRCGKMRRPGRRPGFSMEASGAKYATKRCPWCTGKAARADVYCDRWQIEVNHRDEKDTLGVGQAQLWNVKAVPKQPVLAVAAYSAMLLASLIAFGAERGTAYEALPKWRRNAYRPSCLDLVTLLRKEVDEHPELLKEFEVKITEKQLVRGAAA